MSVFKPFRAPMTRRTVIATACGVKAITLAAALYPSPLYAQQEQRVNIAKVSGLDPLPAVCGDSTGVASSFFSIAGTGATNTVIITASTAKTFICAVDLTTRDSTLDAFLVSGDSTNCSTNSTITGFFLSSYSGLIRPNAGFSQYKPISSNTAVCIKGASSGPYVGSITFYRRGD